MNNWWEEKNCHYRVNTYTLAPVPGFTDLANNERTRTRTKPMKCQGPKCMAWDRYVKDWLDKDGVYHVEYYQGCSKLPKSTWVKEENEG